MARKPERKRRVALNGATIEEVGAVGSLNVTVGQIAKRAGVSSALAFHYFSDPEALFLAAMRHIKSLSAAAARRRVAPAKTGRARLQGIVDASFDPVGYNRNNVSAWLNFDTLALISPEAKRLLRNYQRRLHSNLVIALRPTVGNGAPQIAVRTARLIDGLFLRTALDDGVTSGEASGAHVLRLLDLDIAAHRAPKKERRMTFSAPPAASHFVDSQCRDDTSGPMIKAIYSGAGAVIARVHGATAYVSEAAIASDQDPLEYFGGLPGTLTGAHIPLEGGDSVHTRRESLGICIGIGAWNDPIQIAKWKAARALVRGNAIVFKPSGLAPLSILKRMKNG